MSQREKMRTIAIEMLDKAYAPYSKYHVGACVEAEDGTLFGGCNVENASYGLSICAETNAILHMVTAGRKRIKSIALIGSGTELCTPCGRCRQKIREFAGPDIPIYLCDKSQVVKTVTLGELLPMSFGPDHLE
jgi:cytidine deaminase